MMLEIGYKKFPSELSIDLPISKSIIARQLVIDYIHNTPLADRISQLKGHFIPLDIKYISEALLKLEERKKKGNKEVIVLYTGQSGTAYRFLLVLSLWEKSDTILLHDPQLTKRIKQSDITPFSEIGAEIKFLPDQNQTYISGNRTINGEINDSRWNTSQFSSAILLTKPLHRGCIRLQQAPNRSSYSYYKLTEEVIKEYKGENTKVEGDWSAAAFWYQLMVTHPEIEKIHFNNLSPSSAQPDRKLTKIFNILGINTNANNTLTRLPSSTSGRLEIDLSQSLDLFPSIILSALWLNIPFELSGVKNLRVKESDRISSILENLKRIGVNDLIVEEDTISRNHRLNVPRVTFKREAVLKSFDDHRVAMAFGVLATSIPGNRYELAGSESVNKSYPNFFEALL